MSRSRRVPTISARLTMPLIAELERRGCATAPLLERVGLDERRMRLLMGRVPLDCWSDLCRIGVEACGDPGFPLDAALNIERSSFPLEFYMVSSQLDVKEGMDFAEPFVGSVVDGFETVLEPHAAAARARFLLDGEPLGPPEFAEYFLATLWGFIRLIVPSSPPPTSVGFRHEWPRHGRDLEKVFEAPIRFGEPHVGFVFDLDNVKIPIPGADPELGRLLTAQALAMMHPIPVGIRLKDRVRSWLAGNLAGDSPLGERLATAMGMSERSLRRRLSDEETSLRLLVDEVRQRHALILMERNPRNLDAVAIDLGFANGSAFGRAFRRWTGVAPSEYQRRQAEGASGADEENEG